MTKVEKALKHSLETQIENATGDVREQLQSQLQALRETVRARRKNAAKQKPAYTADADAIVPEERDRMRELRTQMDAETNKKKKADLQAEWDALLDAQIQRFRRAHRRCIMAGAEIPTPTREESDDDDSWDETMEWYRLDIAEASCYRRLNSAKTTMVGRRSAEKEILRISQRRREVRPEYEPAATEAPSAAVPESVDLSEMEDYDLREMFNKERFFRKYLGVTSSGELIANLEKEIRARHMLLVWSVEGVEDSLHSLHVDETGRPVDSLMDKVYMGTVSLPEDHPIWKSRQGIAARPPQKTEERTTFTPTTAQSTYWNRGSKADIAASQPPAPVESVRSLDFAYRLFDGTTFWSWGAVQPANVPLPRTTKVLAAPDPPCYVKGSHVLPDGYVLDPAYFVWRKA